MRLPSTRRLLSLVKNYKQRSTFGRLNNFLPSDNSSSRLSIPFLLFPKTPLKSFTARAVSSMEPNTIVDPSSTSTVGALLNTVTLIMWRMSSLVVGLGVVVGSLLYFKQESMLYFPEVGGIPRRPRDNPRRYQSPAEHQIPFESHQIRCEDGVHIHAWLLLRHGKPVPATSNDNSDKLPTLVFFHGNAGNIGLRLPNALQMLQYLNANILMVEYRGYGDSDSVKPTEAGLKLDGHAALRFIQQHESIDPSRVFLFGRSLGGAVAFDLAMYAQTNGIPLAGVIVENTFLSISHMVDHLMPMLAPFKALVLRMNWDSFRIVPHLTTPVLYLAGANDQLVPHSHMKKLYKSTTSSRLAKIHVVRGGTHNETWMQGGQDYWDAIVTFMKQAMDPSLVDNRYGQASNKGSTATTPARESGSNSAIPIMPSGLFGIARESMRDGSSNNVTSSSASVDPSKKKI